MNKKTDRHMDLPETGSEFFRDVQVEYLIHELKNPIAVVETAVRTLLKRGDKYGPLSERQEKTLNRALRGTKKARDMLHNLMEIGRSEAGCFACNRFRPAKILREVLVEVLEVVAGSAHEQAVQCKTDEDLRACLFDNGVMLDIAPEAGKVEMDQDEVKFRQILGNLLKNALHYRKKQVAVNLAIAGESLVANVTDDGPGIDPAHHDLIFQRYARVNDATCQTMERTGHGLGLAGSRIMAQCLGGGITLQSARGNGATFRLVLPVRMPAGK